MGKDIYIQIEKAAHGGAGIQQMLFSTLATFCFGTESRNKQFPVTSAIPKWDTQERIRTGQEKADPKGHSGKENELEAPGGQGQLMNFRTSQ